MNFDLTNNEIVYLYKHFSMYHDMIRDKLSKELRMERGQLKLYKDIWGETENFDAEVYNLRDQLLNVEMPKLMSKKEKALTEFLDKLAPYFAMINESDPDFVDGIVKEQFEESPEIKEILEQLKHKSNGEQD